MKVHKVIRSLVLQTQRVEWKKESYIEFIQENSMEFQIQECLSYIC